LFDSRCGSASPCWERLNAIVYFLSWGPSSLPVVVAQPNERHANGTTSVFLYLMTDTEHSTTSRANEKNVN